MDKILSFQEFQKVYESENVMVSEEQSVINKETGEPTEDIESLKNLLKDLESEEEVKEGLNEATVNTLKPVKLGETSERVKEIQKLLNLNTSGNYDEATKKAVETFQNKYKLKVDGIVGNQTYGKMLEVKGGVTDKAELKKKVEDFSKSAEAAKKLVSSILSDPNLYGMFESVTIVVVDGQSRVILIPSKDAKQKIEALEASKKLDAGFAWLKSVVSGVGKAIVYTAVAPVVITIDIAKAMINGAISASGFVKKGAISVISSVVHGLGKIAEWIKKKGLSAYTTVKQSGETLWKNFCTGVGNVLKASKEGILAFASAVNSFLGKAQATYSALCFTALSTAAKAAGLAWESAKSLGNAVNQGWKKLAAEGASAVMKTKNTINAGYDQTKQMIKTTGNAVLGGMKSVGKSALKAIGDGINYAGTETAEFGKWISGLAESLYVETGDPVFEALIA